MIATNRAQKLWEITRIHLVGQVVKKDNMTFVFLNIMMGVGMK